MHIDAHQSGRSLTPSGVFRLRPEATNQSDQECDPPGHVAYPGCPKTADDAADAGNATPAEEQQAGGKPGKLGVLDRRRTDDKSRASGL